jgi:hypothetical protein
LKQRLIEGDPVVREPGMSDADIRAMRRTIVVEARMRPAAAPALWRLQPLALAAALAVCLALGVSIGVRMGHDGLPSAKSATSSSPVVAPATRDVRRQLQITAPGGTRIIWTFHENLEL